MNLVFKAAVLAVVCCLTAALTIDDLPADRRSAAVFLLLAYGWLLWRYHKAKQQRSAGAKQASDYLIAFATETGTARSIAKQTAKRLKKIGAVTAVIELSDLAKATPPSRALLVIASTTGNGDPPKSATNWLRDGEVLLPYQSRHFAVLALGDRSYPRFCQFGYDITLALQNAGAISVFEMQRVSNADEDSIEYWHQQLETANETFSEKSLYVNEGS